MDGQAMVPESGHGDAERLQASRERLVQTADSDRRLLERELHDGVQQRLVALAVELQLAESRAGADPAATAGVLEQLRHDIEQAIDEARRLAERIHAPLELGGIAVALRAAAVSAGVPATVEVAGGSSYPDAIARSVFLCWLEALEAAGGEEPAIRVREEDGSLVFELSTGTTASAGLERLRDRVEALGGSLEIDAGPDGGLRASGSLPL